MQKRKASTHLLDVYLESDWEHDSISAEFCCEGIGKAEPFSVVVHNTVHIWEEILKARKIMKKLLKRISNIKIIEEDFMDLLW